MSVVLFSSCSTLRVRIPEREKDNHPELAAAYYFEKRSPDGVTIPTERYFRAMEHVKRVPLYSTAWRARRHSNSQLKDADPATFSLGTWTPLGPGNVGGRTRALVINPGDPNYVQVTPLEVYQQYARAVAQHIRPVPMTAL